MVESAPAQRIEQTIRTYIQACNDADAEAIAACFCPDAVHYFPHIPKWSGAATIGRNFAENVREFGRHWTVDQFIVDVDRGAAALEWTRFDRMSRVIRGVDWFVFDPKTIRIQEVRPYVASAPHGDDLSRQELQDFDYPGRGYPN
jgi:methyltransferase